MLADHLGIDASSDTKLLALCWRLGAEKPGALSEEEWDRFASSPPLPTHGKPLTVQTLKAGWASLDPNFLDNAEFRPFFKFCFECDGGVVLRSSRGRARPRCKNHENRLRQVQSGGD